MVHSLDYYSMDPAKVEPLAANHNDWVIIPIQLGNISCSMLIADRASFSFHPFLCCQLPFRWLRLYQQGFSTTDDLAYSSNTL